jgi:predicted dehydrogenase
MDGRLRVGIAGAGFIGRVHARSALLAGGQLVGVAASSPQSAQAAADELGVGRAYASPDELAADPAIDVIHICTPNHLHVRLAEEALAAGKHVICEKPLALTAADAERIAAVARDAGLHAGVPFVYRYYPTVREARELVRAGGTGAVRLIHGSYLQDWLLRVGDDNWRVDPELGGASRAFADIGSHSCDVAEFLSGHRITRLSARTFTAIPERARAEARKAFEMGDGQGELRSVRTEDAATIQFETSGGAFGSLVVSQVSAGRKNRLWIELDGAEATLAFDQEQPESLWHGRRESLSVVRRDPENLSPAAAHYATLPPGHPQGYADCFDLFVADVYAAIRDGADPDGLPRFADGVRAARLTDAVMASAARRGWVDVGAATEPLLEGRR